MSPENLRERIIEDNESSSYELNSQNSTEGKLKLFSIKKKSKMSPKKDKKKHDKMSYARFVKGEDSSSSSEDEIAATEYVPESYYKSNLDIVL